MSREQRQQPRRAPRFLLVSSHPWLPQSLDPTLVGRSPEAAKYKRYPGSAPHVPQFPSEEQELVPPCLVPKVWDNRDAVGVL